MVTEAGESGFEKKCAGILLGTLGTSGPSGTAELIKYFDDLLARGVLGDRELLKLKESLERGTIVNPIDEDEALTSTTLAIHYEGIEQKLSRNGIDRAELEQWVNKTIRIRHQVKSERTEQRAETQESFRKLEFHGVAPASFRVRDDKTGRVHNIELTHQIEVASTPLTQGQWVRLFGKNPSHFSSGPNMVREKHSGESLILQPDNPVENITWWSALAAANKLSEERGLNPAYDLRLKVWKKGTSAAEGTLFSESGTLRINAPDENIYEAEGYRLPTEYELEYLIQLEAQQNTSKPYRERAWYVDYAGSTTHPVGLLKPLMIDGKELFDILGNVKVWGHDIYTERTLSGKDPRGPAIGDYRITRGVSWYNQINPMSLGRSQKYDAPNWKRAFLGVRLVRTIKTK